MTNDELTTEKEMVEKEKYLRLAADFDNYRKRMTIETEEAREFGKRVVLEDVISILDNFNLAIKQTIKKRGQEDDWAEGLRRALSEFERMLRMYKVERIEAVGKSFDPVTMEAVSVAEGGESQRVKEEVRAGYTMHERVIRPARVIIYE